MASDLDIVLALEDRTPWLSDDAWVTGLLGESPRLIREAAWGPLRERRFQTSSGFEVEFGLVTTAWLAIPIDPGTATVLEEGCRIVWDRGGHAREALTSLALPVRLWSTCHGLDQEYQPPPGNGDVSRLGRAITPG